MVVVGSLVVSQFIALYITPVIYLYLERFQEGFLDRFAFFRSGRVQGATSQPAAKLPLSLKED